MSFNPVQLNIKGYVKGDKIREKCWETEKRNSVDLVIKVCVLSYQLAQ